MVGDFDDEYLAELQEMDRRDRDLLQDKNPITTVVSEEYHQELVTQAQQEIVEAQKVEKARRRKTYLTSEVPVRPCTDECLHRGTCKDFLAGRVSDKDLCRPELKQIKKWQVAFRRGDMEMLKDDAGAVAGALAVQINRLLEKVIDDGIIVDKVTEGKFGETTEKMVHPALKEAASILKTLGIDLNTYLMTPRSKKDAPPAVQVNVGVSFDEIQSRVAARYIRAPETKIIDVIPDE